LDHAFLSLPFFDDSHRQLATTLHEWASEKDWDTGESGERKKIDKICRGYVRLLGESGWLGFAVPARYGGQHEHLDVRSLCIARETLASHSGLADFAFAMQGLGSGPISLFGSADLRDKYLPAVANGSAISAFAISESEAGSDVAAMRTVARRDGDSYVINGEKTWISNGGIADFYVVFARTDDPDTDAEKHFTAFVVEKNDPGFEVASRIDTIAPHPLATIRFNDCRVAAERVVGEPGRGLRVALGTLDVFRTTVGAAALGFARRALREALEHVMHREMFGGKLADFQLTQASIAEMATEIDTSALLIYRSAWTRDNGAERVTREAAMAKMYATEAAQRVIDRAVQLLGGRGVVSGNTVERLYREIRALRIYEGTTEVQKLVIAAQALRHAKEQEIHGA
jgi:alkylation response protein AidB-like acyl-CoA dehydrogenase